MSHERQPFLPVPSPTSLFRLHGLLRRLRAEERRLRRELHRAVECRDGAVRVLSVLNAERRAAGLSIDPVPHALLAGIERLGLDLEELRHAQIELLSEVRHAERRAARLACRGVDDPFRSDEVGLC